MIVVLANIFDTSGFPRRWDCGDWSGFLGWTHVISDLLTWAAYTAIPLVLGAFVLRRKDIPFKRIFWLFGIFIFACGTVHLIEAIIFWHPLYRLSAVIKVVTAIASWGTVLALITVTPHVLAMPALAARTELAEKQIEEVRQMGQIARDNAERLRAVVETAVDAIITIDAQGIIDSANPAAQAMFGYRSEELIGRNVKMIMPAPYRDQHDEYLDNFLTTGVKKIIGIGREVMGQRRDGSIFPVDLAVSEMKVGTRRMFTGIARDVTERKRAAQELLRTAGDLERKSREKQEFFAILAHDLKHPVISIQGLLGLVKNDAFDKLDEESQDNLRLSLSECDRMRGMLERINELGRIDHTELTDERVDLRQLVDGCIERLRAKLASKAIQVVVDVPSVTLRFPRWHVEQSLVNLLDNAINYGCPKQGDRLEITAKVSNGQVIVRVRDFGPGIHPRNHNRVFEPFRRLAPTSEPAGSGMGLTSVRQLMNRIAGDVRVESIPGEGASFLLVFGVGEPMVT